MAEEKYSLLEEWPHVEGPEAVAVELSDARTVDGSHKGQSGQAPCCNNGTAVKSDGASPSRPPTSALSIGGATAAVVALSLT